MQKCCTVLLLDPLGRLLAASADGCCYILDPETLQRTARLILHPSQTGEPCSSLHKIAFFVQSSAQLSHVTSERIESCMSAPPHDCRSQPVPGVGAHVECMYSLTLIGE